jgi:toxin YoeB
MCAASVKISHDFINDTKPQIKQLWEDQAIEDRLQLSPFYYQRISDLIEDIAMNGGRGKPESLTGEYAGWMSRRITKKHRLIYKIEKINGHDIIRVKECFGHYVRK